MHQDSEYGGIIPEGICLWGQLAPTSELPRPRGSLIHNTAFILKSKNSDSTDQFCSLDRASSSRNLVAACEDKLEWRRRNVSFHQLRMHHEKVHLLTALFLGPG